MQGRNIAPMRHQEHSDTGQREYLGFVEYKSGKGKLSFGEHPPMERAEISLPD